MGSGCATMGRCGSHPSVRPGSSRQTDPQSSPLRDIRAASYHCEGPRIGNELTPRRASLVTTPAPTPTPDVTGIDLSQNEFWALSLAERHAAFARLRELDAPPFFEVPENPFTTENQGYYALVRHADVLEASRHADVFSSARGATSLVDLPAEFNEYFGSMINMDDPRHARLRRIVSRAFTPKMIKKFEDDVQRAAAVIVDDLLASGPCDFVSQVSTRLPLKIICDMMGIGDEHYEMVLRNTNVILAGADPEFVSEDIDTAVAQILTAGSDLAALVTTLSSEREGNPGEDLISALATANVDGEKLTPAELASFFVL